jgi:hypothetical protein
MYYTVAYEILRFQRESKASFTPSEITTFILLFDITVRR